MQPRSLAKIILAPSIVLLAACRGGKSDSLDAGLQNALSLASQAQAYRQQQFVSPQELGAQQYPYGQPGMYPNGYAPMPVAAGYAAGPYYAPAPYPAPAPQPVRERVVYRTRSSGSSSRGSSSGSGVVYREPTTRVKKNTKRDAAIGAAAGAAIGVATSARKDRLKGGLLGAVVGAAAGAVIGNNVDKQRVAIP